MLTTAIVTFNSRDTIGRTLESILAQTPECLPQALLIVDNCSTDGTPDVIAEYAQGHGRVSLIRNSRNIGFARAHNQALALIDSEFHVICNPDIVLPDNAFAELRRFMDHRPDIGIACPRFTYPDGRLQPLNRRHPTVCDLFLRRFLPRSLQPAFQRRLAAYEMLDVGYDHACDVPFMTGALMFCRTGALKKVGGFDERFFLYFEDADLSRRVQALGLRTVYCHLATVTHNWQRMAHKDWRMAWVFALSARSYFRKWGWRLW
jgi:GT2 family glycosyltransferase